MIERRPEDSLIPSRPTQLRVGLIYLDGRSVNLTAVWVALAVLGCGISLIATQQGIGASPDSVAYIGAARNLVAGRGLSLPFGGWADSPLTQYPPLYPVTLAAAAAAGGNVLGHARWLAALLFAANIIIVALWTAEGMPRTRWLSPVAGAGFLLSPSIASLHLMAWSEPLFLFLGGLGLWLLFRARTDPTWWPLVLSGLLFGGATLTRYAGLAYTLTGFVALLSDTDRKWRERLLRTGAVGMIAVVPIAIWVIRNQWLFGNATGRTIAFHPVGAADLWLGLNTAADWLLIPQSWPRRPELALGLIAVAALLVGITLWRMRRVRKTAGKSVSSPAAMRRLLLQFVACYGLFLLFSISFVDANTQLDSRILSPVLMAIIPLAVSYGYQLYLGLGNARPIRRLLAAIPALYLVFMAIHTFGLVRASSTAGIGFNHQRWRKSALIAAAADLPANGVIYSNAPEPLYLLAGLRSVLLPKKFETMGERPNPGYQVDLQRMQDAMVASNGTVVYFNLVSSSSVPTVEELRQTVPLVVKFENVDGSILGLTGGR